MGRGGRGGGGGHSRGGSFGGSRGFSSHSGSTHRSSYSGSHSYHSSHHYSSGPRFYYFNSGGNRYYNSGPSGPVYSSGTRNGDMKWFGKMIVIIFVIIILVYAFGSAGNIQRSTIEREKLDSNTLVETRDYYTDELDWIHDSSELEEGMKYFYDKTGVQPYLYITDTIDGNNVSFSNDTLEDYANDLYDKLFEDEAHLLVVFFERNDYYRTFCLTGTEAKTVVDEEAREILLDYLDQYYYSDMSEEEYFSTAFEKAADRMMRVTPNYRGIILILVLGAVIIYLLFKWWKKKKQSKLDEMNRAEKILGQDLNEFGTAGGYTTPNYGTGYTAPNYGAQGYTPPPGTGYNAAGAQGQGMQNDTSNIDELKKKYDN